MPNQHQIDSAAPVVASSAEQLPKEAPDAGVAQAHYYSSAVEPVGSAAAEVEHRKRKAAAEGVHRTMMAAETRLTAGDPSVDELGEVDAVAIRSSSAAEGNRIR